MRLISVITPIISICLLFCISFYSYAQRSLNLFLGSAQNDVRLEAYNKQVEYLDRKPFRSLPLENVQIRTENDEIGTRELQYGLRFTPTNPFLSRNTNRFFKSYKHSLLLKKELELKEVLLSRYGLSIDLLTLYELKSIREALVENLSNQVEIMSRQSGSSIFDSQDFIKSKLELLKEQSDLEAFNFRIEQKRSNIKKVSLDLDLNLDNWTYDSVISVCKLSQIVDSLHQMPSYLGTTAYLKEKITLAERAFAIERSDFNVGFIQSNYEPGLAEGDDKMGLSFGLTIPIFHPNNSNKVERKLELLDAQAEMNVELRLAEEESKDAFEQIKNYISRYNDLDEKIRTINPEETISTISALGESNPLIVMKFQLEILKLEILKAEIRKEIFINYIDFLSATDHIQAHPLRNYLSENLGKI